MDDAAPEEETAEKSATVRMSGVCFAYPATREDVNYAQMTESDWILNRIDCIETLDVGYQIRNCGGSRLEEFAG